MPSALAERSGAAERATGVGPAAPSFGLRRRGRAGWKHASRPSPNRPGPSPGPARTSAQVSVGGYDSPGPRTRRGVVFTTKRHYTLDKTVVAVRDSAGAGSLNSGELAVWEATGQVIFTPL